MIMNHPSRIEAPRQAAKRGKAVGPGARAARGRGRWACSIIVLGLMVALSVKAPVWLGAVLVGLFAFFHGHAHGTEAAAASLVAYGAGFTVATAGLHAAGIGLALTAEGSIGKRAVQAVGALTVLGGLALIGV